MTLQQLEHPGSAPVLAPALRRRRTTLGTVLTRRAVGLALVVGPLAWAATRAVPASGDVVNTGGLSLLAGLLSSALHPAHSSAFLLLVLHGVGITLVFAALGTAGALLIGVVGGLVLSDVAWGGRASWPVRAVRLALRGVLVAIRSIHELIWALLLVSVLGLDPLVAVLAIALPFGAQTAKVFAETLDAVPPGPLATLRLTGAPPATAMGYALLPAAAPLLLSYSFYRFECAIRSVVVLGAVGVGGLGQELVVSLSSRNWDEVWTLIAAVLLLSAATDLWSSLLRADLAVVSCSDWSSGTAQSSRSGHSRLRSGARDTTRWARWSAVLAVPGLVVAWFASGASWSGLTSDRTRQLTGRLLDDLWPPQVPPGGWGVLLTGVLDTVAMAVLAMAIAVAVTLVVGPWAARRRRVSSDRPLPWLVALPRRTGWVLARLILLVLRSVPPTVWAVIALLALFPGVLPGALALGLYTGGILGRLVAEAWESVDTRSRENLVTTGTPRWLAGIAATVPPSAGHLVGYTLYRFEICVRDTAVVGVVGAAGLGRLFAENVAVFRFPALTTLLAASFGLSVASELLGRRLRSALRP